MTALLCLLLSLCCVMQACGEKPQTATVRLMDGDAVIGEGRVTVGMEFSFGVPTKTGYTFLGWYAEKDGGAVYTDAEGNSSGLTWQESYPNVAYACWQVKDYKITLDYCGATEGVDVTSLNVTYDAVITGKLPVPKKENASFLGWYTEKSKGEAVTDAAGNFLEGKNVYNSSVYTVQGEGSVLYARFGERKVTYAFDTGDGTAVADATYVVGEVLYELPFTTLDNYCFTYWSLDPTSLLPVTFPHTVSDASGDYVTLYANFEAATSDLLSFSTVASTGDREYEVTYTGNAERIVIPDTYYGKRVTRVKLINSTTLKELVLPQSVTSFGVGALEGCSALETVNIPVGVTEIPIRCFSGCTSLTAITIPYKVETIAKEAFAGCASIREIALSKNVKTVGAGAFKNMTALEAFTVEEDSQRYKATDGVLYQKVGASTHLVQYPAAKQGETYTIDSTAVKVLDYAFSSSGLSSIVIGGKITTLEAGAFENCKNLVNVSVTVSAGSFSIGNGVFRGCSNLKMLRVETGKVPSLHATALEGVGETFCIYVVSDMIRTYQTATNWRTYSDKIRGINELFGDFAVEEVAGGYAIRQYFGTAKEVVIPEILNAHNIVKISDNAFALSGVEKITVSKYVTEIGSGAFRDCAALTSLVLECEPPLLGSGALAGTNEDIGIYVKNTADVLDAYKVADGWSAFAEDIWSYQ